MDYRKFLKPAMCLFIMAFLLLGALYVFSEDNGISENIPSAAGDVSGGEIKKLEEKEAEAKDALSEAEVKIEEVKKEAASAIEEKEAIEKEAKLKEEAAAIAKKEQEILKKEAEITNDTKVLKEVKKLAAEAKRLEEEADVHKEKAKIKDSKAQLAQKKVENYETEIEEIKKSLQSLRVEKAGKRSLIEKAMMSVAIIVMGLILFVMMRLGVRGFERLITKEGKIRQDEATLRMKTLGKLFNWLGGIAILIVAAYMILQNFGFDVAPLLAGAGIVGLAFGFGGQYLIRDLINGLFILIEGQYRINDVVKIGEHGGLVEDINLRITTLRDLEGRVIVIPNGEVKTVINYTREYAQALFDIGVAYKENVDRVMDVIKQIGSEMKKDKYFGRLILDDLEMFGVDDFGDSQVTIKFRIKTLPIKQWEVMREFRRRLKNRFDELGIEIPFPHRTLYWGSGKENEWLKDLADQMASKKPK